MKFRLLGLAAIALACTTVIASAQTVAPPAPQALGALLKGVVKGGGVATPSAGATANLSSGWNLQHCYTSIWYTDGTNNYLFAFNLEGTYFYTENDIYTANTLLHVCDYGYEYGVYVTNTSTGAYSEIYSKW
jgi:hypothetical protein